MKKTILSIAMIIALGGVWNAYAQTPEEFLNGFKHFVSSLSADQSFSPELKERADSIYHIYTREYETIGEEMTNTQKEEYYQYKGRYDQYVITVESQQTARAAKQKGKNIFQKARDGMKTAFDESKGYVEGLTRKDKKEKGHGAPNERRDSVAVK